MPLFDEVAKKNPKWHILVARVANINLAEKKALYIRHLVNSAIQTLCKKFGI
jgi:hypothetical protein